MEEFFTIISNFGFPVAVASYLLFRFEKKLEALEVTNQEKTTKIETLILEVKSLEKKIMTLKEIIKKRK